MVYRDVNFMYRDVSLQHDLNGRNTIFFFMHQTASYFLGWNNVLSGIMTRVLLIFITKTECSSNSNIIYQQNTWTDVLCSVKCKKSMLCLTTHVPVVSDTQNIQSFDRPKWRCALCRYTFSRLLSDQTTL